MSKQFVFVGNRRFVLQAMLDCKLDIGHVFVVKGTHLERDIENGAFPLLQNVERLDSKQTLLDRLRQISFDILVSNGCSYILPISQLPTAKYVNIHPSFLPDLKGVDPVIGSILFKRDAGATCHVMDEGIDTGDIISQVHIPFTDDLDVTTLYQLSFEAEKDVFRLALNRNFKAQAKQEPSTNDISYRRSSSDFCITFEESNQEILQKIKAFNNRSIGCSFSVSGRKFRVFDAKISQNPYLKEVVFREPAGKVVFSYEGNIIFHKNGEVVRFINVQSEDGQNLIAGDMLFGA